MIAVILEGFTDPQTMPTPTLETAIIAARVHSDTDSGAATWVDIAARELEFRIETDGMRLIP
jgi:hypothetical protein